MKKNLRFMYDGYGDDREHEEYREITMYVEDEVQRKLKEVLSKDKEAVELNEKMKENNKTYFDKNNESLFQSDYGFTDDWGEDYPDYSFNQSKYDSYLKYVHNFPEILDKLNQEKAKLESGFHFNKKKKLADIAYRIEEAHKIREACLKVYEREKLFKETWYKDGKFVDLNAEYKEKLNEIKNRYVKQLAEECIDRHPELMMYEFEGTHLTPLVEKAITEAQKTRTLSTEKTKKTKETEKVNEEEVSTMGME